MQTHNGEEVVGGGAMLPVFLNDLERRRRGGNDDNGGGDDELVEVTLQLEHDSVVVYSVTPPCNESANVSPTGFLRRSLSATTASIRKKFAWLRSSSEKPDHMEEEGYGPEAMAMAARDWRRMKARLQRDKSGAQHALTGLRFISRTANGGGGGKGNWENVESRFESLSKDGLLSREDFGLCIGMGDSKEFAVGIFDALARRKGQNVRRITREELKDFWMQMSDQSFDARLKLFFDMADSNEDGRITKDEVQELIMLSASANKLSKLNEQAKDYASLIMEELDPENLGYIELWQLETLLLQRDTYMNCSRQLSSSPCPNQNITSYRPRNTIRRTMLAIRCFLLENWQRCWILLLWVIVMASLFAWKFNQYRHSPAFEIMGYCLTTAKGAAETIKLNMALILLPVCRNTLTWLRSTRARLFVPFDDNINFHMIIACAIALGVLLHAGNHLLCDFPRILSSSPAKFALISSDFNDKKPTYMDFLVGVEGITGIAMVILMIIAFTLATNHLRKNLVRLPAPFNRLTGFNAFWYAHHLTAVVYVLLFIHGTCLYFVHKWYEKTTWMYISAPLLLYAAERSLRSCRSEYFLVKILKVSDLPGNVFSLIMSKPPGFKYKSGQYVFLKCPAISSFEWHPFSITSAPGDDYLSVHIRTVGDWTQELKQVLIENQDSSVIGRAKFSKIGKIDNNGLPRLLVDGPYGAPAQDYRNYDILLLVGLGIGATPFISIVRDLIHNAAASEELMDSNTEISTSDDSLNSLTSTGTSSTGKRKLNRTMKAHFYWVTREPGSMEWFKGVMDEVAEMDHKGQIDMHTYLTSVYEEGDARSTLLTLIQALNHAKYGVDILSGTRVRTHFARPNWKDVFTKIASKHPNSTVGVFYCGNPVLAKELKKLSSEVSHTTSTRFDFHKESF